MGPPKADLRAEDLIQAVVVTDPFNTASFAPLTVGGSGLPACLLPLSGRPLLEYILEV